MRAILSKVLTGSLIASAAMGVREGDEQQVFQHPCGKREILPRGTALAPCAACRAMYAPRPA